MKCDACLEEVAQLFKNKNGSICSECEQYFFEESELDRYYLDKLLQEEIDDG